MYQTYQIPANGVVGATQSCSGLDIPSDSELIYSETNYSNDEWTEEIICFTALDFPKYQILFVPTSNSGTFGSQEWLVDLVCIEAYSLCESTTDLTACAEEGDFGFIHLDCEDGLDLEFDWDFPQGSTAIEICDGATILQASEGTYTVTITNSSGCSDVETFEIVSDCCITCEAPTGLDCKLADGFARLGWDDMSNAIDYEITIISGAFSSCDCSGPSPGTIQTFSTGGNNYYDVSTNFSSCFSWTVKAICGEKDGISESSSVMCYNFQDGCFEPKKLDGKKKKDTKIGSSTLIPKVFPNPSKGILNFELQAPDALTLNLEIYSLDGKLVKAFGEEKYPDGNYKKRWSVDQTLADGIYTVVFKTNFGVFQEKLVISKESRMQN